MNKDLDKKPITARSSNSSQAVKAIDMSNALHDQHHHPLRFLSAEEFAELGGDQTVFVRSISSKQLADFIPEASTMPGEIQFQLIMGADGVPILITDSQNALSDWFDQNEVTRVCRH